MSVIAHASGLFAPAFDPYFSRMVGARFQVFLAVEGDDVIRLSTPFATMQDAMRAARGNARFHASQPWVLTAFVTDVEGRLVAEVRS